MILFLSVGFQYYENNKLRQILIAESNIVGAGGKGCVLAVVKGHVALGSFRYGDDRCYLPALAVELDGNRAVDSLEREADLLE